MPRIVPIQLLKCLRTLLDDNGGILKVDGVKRLAGLMTKYSKKLVSKCIYVQILKCTKTELLGEFMGAGGWSLVYTWLNDAIRAMNWPLVQEILELLLLCPVDVHRLKINSAPKLVKGLCKDGGNEGVRILAKRLVEQWLKVVTENPVATLPTSNMTQQATVIKTPTVAVVAPEAISVNVQQQQTSVANSENQNTPHNAQHQQQQLQQKPEEQKIKTNRQTKSNKISNKEQDFEREEDDEAEDEEDEEEEEIRKENELAELDPLGGVDPEPTASNYNLTPAQKKASESGLVYKFIIKDGQSILAKVPPKSNRPIQTQSSVEEEDEEEEGEAESNEVVDAKADDTEAAEDAVENLVAVAEAEENSSSLDKTEKDNDSNSGSDDKMKIEETKKSEDKKSIEDKEKSNSHKDRQSSKDKERRVSSSSIDKEKDKEIKTLKSSSSSSSHRSSSNHKSSSSSKSSSTSSSKSKSSSSSSSHRSSSDKHRSDKERSSSSKDKDRDRTSGSSSSSNSNNKHRSSSSSKSSSSSSSSKDKYKDKEKSSSSSSSKSKDKQEQSQTDKDKASLEKVTSSSSVDKLGKIPKKSKEDSGANNDTESSSKPTSITIPSKKASMSIEIRKDTEKAKTVKTYKSQFRSHGLTEEAPPPPSRKGLKKPSSTTPPGTVLPSSLPSSLKRTSPPPRDVPSEKKAKIDINNVTVTNEKPGAIKLIPPKKIQTLVETNLFSDALSAATGPKKVNKRKRPNTPLVNGKEGPASPTSPDAPKVMPLKFYQDTLDESKTEDSKSKKENDAAVIKASEEIATADDKDIEDDDDIPLKKVKEDIEQKVAKEMKLDGVGSDVKTVDITKDDEEEQPKAESSASPSRQLQQDTPKAEEDDAEIVVEKKPGPGCGPDGPPGVLMLHRRKGPKKKLSWRPQETLEQIRYFELDENERCNVSLATSFMDMKNMERFSERDAFVLARRGFNHEDNMEAQTHWKALIEVDEVPPHPEGNQSKQRKIQAERELTTLRALYFTHALIPDSPAEAEFEPAFNQDVPLIPLDDLTGNPDAVNDFTSMPWPEPRGSPKQGDNSMSGTGGLGSPVNMFGSPSAQVVNMPNSNKQGSASAFNPFVNPFVVKQGTNGPNGPSMQSSPQNQWQGPGNGMGGPMAVSGPMMGNPFSGNHETPLMDMGGPGPMGSGPMMSNGPPPNFLNQFPPNFGGPPNPFMGGPPGFNNGPNNFGPMVPNGPMMNGMGAGPMGNNCPPQMMNGGHINRNNRGNNNGGNWRSGGSNFQDNNSGGGNWRPAGPGHNIRGGGGGNGNNGVCKAFMRGHCRLGNSCKYIHPNKSKRI